MENDSSRINELRGISRRDFMRFCMHVTAALGLSHT
jgi:hypothetical protein